MLELADEWLWDFWIADTGSEWHLFYLHAPRSLVDPERRHAHASVGHAVSVDLWHWELRGNALLPGPVGAFDETAIWTGSLVRGDDGAWWMFYTGMSNRSGARIQRIGIAVSDDLARWRKHSGNPVLGPDHRWYERQGDSAWPGDAWRDPWVFRDPSGEGWHMLLTARSADGEAADRGVIGHARSMDLLRWDVMPPLSRPGAGFGQLEVAQIEIVGDRPVLVFSCRQAELAGTKSGSPGGIWAVAASSVLGPYDTADASLLSDERLYAGRLCRDRAGNHVMLACRNRLSDGSFPGTLSDPIRVGWNGLRLRLQPSRTFPRR